MKDKKTKALIWSIPMVIAIIIVLFHIISFIYDYKMLNAIYQLIIKNGYSDEVLFNLNNFLKTYDSQYLITGMEIVGIAISVWIGLNIYNVVKRDSIKELETIAKETRVELEDFRNNYQTYNLTALENAKFEEERINDYLVGALKEFGKNVLDYNSTKSIVFIEKTIQLIIEYLDSENYYLMEKNLNNLEEKLIQLEKDIDIESLNSIKSKEKETINNYLNVRYGDYNYYMGLLYLKSINNNIDLMEAKYSLKKAYKYYSKVEYDEEQVVRTYINNVQGYICYLLYGIINKIGSKKEKEKNPDNIKNALHHSKTACSKSNDSPCETKYARDHRNYGVNIENMAKINNLKDYNWYEEMVKAFEQYEIALKYDKKDINTLTCIASCILKIFDEVISITTDEKDENELLEKLKKLKDYNLPDRFNEFIVEYSQYNEKIHEKIYIEMIQKANDCLTTAQIIKPTAIAPHYHAIHVSMYNYMIDKDEQRRTLYREKGNNEIIICEALYRTLGRKMDKAFLYKARNFYYCIGDFDKGMYYNNLI